MSSIYQSQIEMSWNHINPALDIAGCIPGISHIIGIGEVVIASMAACHRSCTNINLDQDIRQISTEELQGKLNTFYEKKNQLIQEVHEFSAKNAAQAKEVFSTAKKNLTIISEMENWLKSKPSISISELNKIEESINGKISVDVISLDKVEKAFEIWKEKNDFETENTFAFLLFQAKRHNSELAEKGPPGYLEKFLEITMALSAERSKTQPEMDKYVGELKRRGEGEANIRHIKWGFIRFCWPAGIILCAIHRKEKRVDEHDLHCTEETSLETFIQDSLSVYESPHSSASIQTVIVA